jgi:hypothetical protein
MNARRITIWVAVLLYVASLLLPAGCVVIKPPFGMTVGPNRPFYGYLAFFVTMVEICKPSWEAAWLFGTWLANPAFWLGLFWYVKRRRGRAAAAGLLSLGLGLSVLPGAWELIDGWPGYWVWLASFVTLFLGSLFDRAHVAGPEDPILSAGRAIAERSAPSNAEGGIEFR